MIEEAGVRFNNGDYYHLKVDTDIPECEVTGTIDGEPVEFSGGGGSNDLTLATVTFDTDMNMKAFPFIDTSPVEGLNSYWANHSMTQGVEYKVPLYKGKLVINDVSSSLVIISGDATFEDRTLIITGDCIIGVS